MDDADDLDSGIAALEARLGEAAAMTAAFEAELARMQTRMAETETYVRSLSGGFSRGIRRAFDGLIFDGQKLSDALRGLGRSFAGAAYGAAIRPVTSHLGGLLAEGVGAMMGRALPFARGGGFVDGQVIPFAEGGVVRGPATFPMRGGATGLMGEAGPEAIMPLSRGADGRLGVRMQGGGRAVQVTVNVSTPDVEGFRRSSTQIAAEMARALGRAERNG